jgi:hypothetical protein
LTPTNTAPEKLCKFGRYARIWYMTTTTKRSFTSKKGVTILEGEKVSLTFDVKSKTGEILPWAVRLATADGRKVAISTRSFKAAGIRVPSMRKLESWSSDSVCKSVFGADVEPDGWSYDGSPSWLLALGWI